MDVSGLQAEAADVFDPVRLTIGLLAAGVIILVALIVLKALWQVLRPELAEILEPLARRMGRGYTRNVHGDNGPGTPWLCVPCRSYNDGRRVHCYRCGAERPAVEGPPPAIN